MLRASRVVCVSGSGLLARSGTHVGQIRSVSTQLIRDRVPKQRKTASFIKTKYNRLKTALETGEEPEVKAGAREKGKPRKRSKHNKLAGKLAEIKAKSGGKRVLSSVSAPSLTTEQREVLELIQSPVVSTGSAQMNPRAVMLNTLGNKSSETMIDAEGVVEDKLTGWYIDRSNVVDLPSMDDKQISSGPSLRVNPIFSKEGRNLTHHLHRLMAKRRRAPFMYQEINMPARYEALERQTMQTVIEELNQELENEKIYQKRLQELNEHSSLSSAQQKEYQTIKEARDFGSQRVEQLAERFLAATTTEDGGFSLETLRPAIVKEMLACGTDFVRVTDIRSNGFYLRKSYAEFKEEHITESFLPQASVTDGIRCYAKYGSSIVCFPFYKFTGPKLMKLLNKSAPVEEDLSYSVFQLPETEKDRYYQYRRKLDEVYETEAELVDKVVEQADYQDVSQHLDSLRPLMQILPTEQWDRIANDIETNILVNDLRQYIRDQTWKRDIPLSKYNKGELIDLLRKEIWDIHLTDSLKSDSAVSTITLNLTDMQKQLLFKYHSALVQLWVSRGADVKFSPNSNEQLVVTARQSVLEMVKITLRQFGRKIESLELYLPKPIVRQLTPEHWKSLEKASKSEIVKEDGTLMVYAVGNALKSLTIIKQYIDNMFPGDRFSQQIIYQTDKESVSKSAYFPRTVSSELPWYKRVIPKWARWREIHSMDSIVNTEKPELSLVSAKKVTKLPTDQSLQTIIADTLMAQLEAIPRHLVTQDPEKVVDGDYSGISEKLEYTARDGAIAPTYDPAANNVSPTVYEKVAIQATLGHLVHANETSRDSKGRLNLKKIDPFMDVHFSGSVPYVNERISKNVPKPQPAFLKRYRMVVDCVPLSADAPSVQIESIPLHPNEKLWFRYPPVRLYATTRQANLLVSLPSVNSDLKFSATSRQKILPTQDFYVAWKDFWGKLQHQEQTTFVFNIDGQDVEYKIRNISYSRYDEYHMKTTFERFSSEPEAGERGERQGGVLKNIVTNGGDLNGLQNEVSVQTIWRDYKIKSEALDKEQHKSDQLLDEFVGNSLKFMDSLDSESQVL